MDNIRAVIKNLFCYISPQDILYENTVFDNLSRDTFEKLGNSYITKYSNDELYNMYYYLENEFYWQNRKYMDEPPEGSEDRSERFNVFDTLVAFNNAVLIEEDGEPKCQYAHILRWRDMIVELEEDLFITSYLAYKDGFCAYQRNDFFWKPVIGHNNRALNRLVEQGVAENHFHLKGSAPHFHLSWISLMNDVANPKFREQLDIYGKSRLQRKYMYDLQYGGGQLTHMWRQAALIRIFLLCVLHSSFLSLRDYYLSWDDILELCAPDERESLRKVFKSRYLDKELVSVSEVCRELEKREKKLEEDTIIRLKRQASANWVEKLLKDEMALCDAVGDLKANIELLKEKAGGDVLDYAICEGYLAYNEKDRANEILSGERWFMYECFRRIYRKDDEDAVLAYANWFYLYLVIKANIRKELVQANQNVGFDNFDRYQFRKDYFIEGTSYEDIYLRMAVRDTINNQHITSLEARVMPKDTEEAMKEAIAKYDRAIVEGLDDEQKHSLMGKYFYVVHFAKEPEHCVAGMEGLEECRHFQKRKKVMLQARALAALRDSGEHEALRIKGIDACSSEIWCRPEVFAQAFRFLKEHAGDSLYERYTEERCSHLMATYHVGEDFLDIIDGLRAIDEAIGFLNLRCGDRLGHALALGVDIDEWYEGKGNRIVINKMGYLDNLVWLYAKLRQYRIGNCMAAAEYIEKTFDEYFKEIYRNNMHSVDVCSIFANARKYYDGLGVSHGYNYYEMHFGINEYYDAWKLRGDNPELYRKGYLRLKDNIFDPWDEYAINKEFPINYKIRYNPETAILYYMYHYNEKVKVVGDQVVEVRVNSAIREAVKVVRECMQRRITEIGIGIETNPSSNYLIGTFRRYDKHPISRWYNLGLTNDQDELDKCPQMQVSINTDDQGVFATYLENEYAYLALALEKCVDQSGQKRYNRTMILQWLDNIRKNGINQSFGGKV